MLKSFERATRREGPVTLKEVCETYMQFAQDVRQEDGQLDVCFVIGMTNNDGTSADMLCPLINKEMVDNRRKALHQLGKKLAIDNRMGYFVKIDYVAVVSEAWMSVVDKKDRDLGKRLSGEMMPSQDPNKIEVIIVNAADGEKDEVLIKKIIKRWDGELGRVVVSLEDTDPLKEGGVDVDLRTPDQKNKDEKARYEFSLLNEFFIIYKHVVEDDLKDMPELLKTKLVELKAKNLNTKLNYAQFEKENSNRERDGVQVIDAKDIKHKW